MVFSSSATVYGDAPPPLSESAAYAPTNPYGQTMVMCEQILKDLIVSDSDWSTVILRYFTDRLLTPKQYYPDSYRGRTG